ncbi:uncharacterized protein LOC129914838 [Episyrphus balteatus]|uniref:uncharacterized protein LOC129905542 n=1 Tax=Episyrphus balteatus TaxID=286459 RepID=UPI0024854AB2|nr:uncharacterized protein LOC129905542 [Episyrphus balteatus]XP_055850237.1 uncharacterized protein LOC129914838 [Episyrphus balteatus]
MCSSTNSLARHKNSTTISFHHQNAQPQPCAFRKIKIKKNDTKTTTHVFGKYSGDQFQTSMTEFTVRNFPPRHPERVKRILCLVETTIPECDPQTCSVCTLRPLVDVFALIQTTFNNSMSSIKMTSETPCPPHYWMQSVRVAIKMCKFVLQIHCDESILFPSTVVCMKRLSFV